MSLPVVKVVLVGDQGVGKTSLILCGADTFKAGPAVPVLQPTAFRVHLASADCTCICYDTTSLYMEDVKAALRQADVVLVCFGMSSSQSLHNALDHWLPHAISTNADAPVLLVGCKRDLSVIGESERARVEHKVSSLVNVVGVEECSALSHEGVAVAFQRACDASLHPVRPLYDHVEERLRCRAIRAFNRIFQLVDEDANGALSDLELQKFHQFVFGRPWAEGDLQGTRQTLMESCAEAVTTEGITRIGFMQLQALVIKRERLDICWTMLHHFGYDRRLELQTQLFESAPEHWNVSTATIAQLSQEAVDFLTTVFKRHSSPSGLLPMTLLLEDPGPHSLFTTAPPCRSIAQHPLGRQNIRDLMVVSRPVAGIPLPSFLCIWAYCTLVDARRVVQAMVYLGFPDTYGTGVHQVVGSTAVERLLVCCPRRKSPGNAAVPRPLAVGVRVFSCLLFGSKGCGKTSLLRAFSGCNQGGHEGEAGTSRQAALLIPQHGEEPNTVMILTEVPDAIVETLSISAAREPANKCRLLASDAMLFGCDSTSEDSYQRALNLLVALSDATRNVVPVTFLGLKSNLGTSSSIQRRAEEDCRRLGVHWLPGPDPEAKQAEARLWAQQVLDVACNPGAHIAMTPALAAQKQRTESTWRAVRWAGVVAMAGAGVVASYYLYSYLAGRAQTGDTSKQAGAESRETQPVTAPPAAAVPKDLPLDISAVRSGGQPRWLSRDSLAAMFGMDKK